MEKEYDTKKVSILIIAIFVIATAGGIWLYFYLTTRITPEQEARIEVFNSLTRTSEDISQVERDQVLDSLKIERREITPEERRAFINASRNQF